MVKLNIVLGNHISRWGIEDILDVLQSSLGDSLKMTQSPFLAPGMKNLVVEDFSNPRFTNYLVESESKLILLLTEFPITILGKIYLNRFGFKASKIFLLIDAILSPFYSTIFRVSTGRVRSFAHTRNYWRAREKSLRYVLSKGIVECLITLHPEITKRIHDSIQPNFVKTFTLYPVIRSRNILKAKAPNAEIVFATFGSANRYRQREIRRANEYLPQGIQRLNEELANEIMADIVNKRVKTIPAGKILELSKVGFSNAEPESTKFIIDFYFRNSAKWKYLSPIRIARSINRERPVLYIGNKLEDHPINELVLQISSYNQLLPRLGKIEEELAFHEKKIDSYNNFASSENAKFIEACNVDFK